MSAWRRSPQSGMTLIEVLIALVLLSFGLLAIAPLFASSVKNGASSNQLTNANTLAREKLEEVIGYPATDPRLAVPAACAPAACNAAGPSGLTTIGTGSVVGYNSACDNDLPAWYAPSSGATSNAATSPGPGWYRYPFSRSYTIEQFGSDLATRVPSPGTYFVKRIIVTVRATMGPFPGLRQTKQSVWVRFRDVS
jgi:prepilin-type N-terminal cleavage/methylation domain-containing protein